MLQQMRYVLLNGFQLVQVQIGVCDGENIAGFGMFVNKHPLTFARELFFYFEDAFAFQHHGENKCCGCMTRVVLLYEFAQYGFRSVFLNGFNRLGCRRFIDPLPMRDEAGLVAGCLSRLLLPAGFADVGAAQQGSLVEE